MDRIPGLGRPFPSAEGTGRVGGADSIAPDSCSGIVCARTPADNPHVPRRRMWATAVGADGTRQRSELAPPTPRDDTEAVDRVLRRPADEPAVLVDDAVALARRWAAAPDRAASRTERRAADRLADLLQGRSGVEFAMRFVDRVVRPEDRTVAARELIRLA